MSSIEVITFNVQTKEFEETNKKLTNVHFPNLIDETIYYYSSKLNLETQEDLYRLERYTIE